MLDTLPQERQYCDALAAEKAAAAAADAGDADAVDGGSAESAAQQQEISGMVEDSSWRAGSPTALSLSLLRARPTLRRSDLPPFASHRPDGLLFHMFSFLPARDLIQCSLVCFRPPLLHVVPGCGRSCHVPAARHAICSSLCALPQVSRRWRDLARPVLGAARIVRITRRILRLARCQRNAHRPERLASCRRRRPRHAGGFSERVTGSFWSRTG